MHQTQGHVYYSFCQKTEYHLPYPLLHVPMHALQENERKEHERLKREKEEGKSFISMWIKIILIF